MDINIWPTYPENFGPNFFLAKEWLKNTLPTYSLDICPNFRSFFLDPPQNEICPTYYKNNKTLGKKKGKTSWLWAVQSSVQLKLESLTKLRSVTSELKYDKD